MSLGDALVFPLYLATFTFLYLMQFTIMANIHHFFKYALEVHSRVFIRKCVLLQKFY